jgi:hypothetical protein
MLPIPVQPFDVSLCEHQHWIYTDYLGFNEALNSPQFVGEIEVRSGFWPKGKKT